MSNIESDSRQRQRICLSKSGRLVISRLESRTHERKSNMTARLGLAGRTRWTAGGACRTRLFLHVARGVGAAVPVLGNSILGYIHTPSLFAWLYEPTQLAARHNDNSYGKLIPFLVVGHFLVETEGTARAAVETLVAGTAAAGGGAGAACFWLISSSSRCFRSSRCSREFTR